MSTQHPQSQSWPINPAHRIAIVAARFNGPIVDRLLAGCTQRLGELGVAKANVALFRVPGAFELPLAGKIALEHFDAVICLGAVIRGETYHFETVANEAAAGIRQIALDAGKPAIFGVLTVENQSQALDRTGGPHGHAGTSAAEAAIELLSTLTQIRTPRTPPSQKLH